MILNFKKMVVSQFELLSCQPELVEGGLHKEIIPASTSSA